NASDRIEGGRLDARFTVRNDAADAVHIDFDRAGIRGIPGHDHVMPLAVVDGESRSYCDYVARARVELTRSVQEQVLDVISGRGRQAAALRHTHDAVDVQIVRAPDKALGLGLHPDGDAARSAHDAFERGGRHLI